MTTRPDLFGAVISRVGMSNPLRAEFEPNGKPNIPEFGTVADEAGFKALKAMDSYHAVQDGVDYPAMLLITGINDARVEPYNASKMVARLQAAHPSSKAIMRVDWDAGHMGGGNREKRMEDVAGELSFVLHHCADR
jgi:prolyl oligopeptidase